MKEDLRVSDMIVVSVISKQTGLPDTYLVTNRPRWSKDSNCILKDWIIRIEIFPIGSFGQAKFTFHSLEEFEDAINLSTNWKNIQ